VQTRGKAGQLVRITGRGDELPLRLGYERLRPVRLVAAVQRGEGEVHGVRQLSGVSQYVPPGSQRIRLPGRYPGSLELARLILQHVRSALALRFVHRQLFELPFLLRQLPVYARVLRPLRLQPAERVEIPQVSALIEQLSPVVLAVDVDKAPAKRAERRRGHGHPVYAAGAFPIG